MGDDDDNHRIIITDKQMKYEKLSRDNFNFQES